ncbi:MAG: sigma-54 dependent transcriptional regulator [Deltaproteobacteria bacterium]|nr:sigma-54 dependent transcriptional regulator [Deltaproteobacteria bacterium]
MSDSARDRRAQPSAPQEEERTVTDRILVVDDDRNILKLIGMRLESEGYEVYTAPDGERAKTLAREHDFDLALLDLKLIGVNGIDLMEDLHAVHPDMSVIILTAHGTIQSAVDAMKKGAYSYITKPFDARELSLQIRNGLEKGRLSREVKRLRGLVSETSGFGRVIGKSAAMKRVMQKAAQAAEADANVYISGESGTGKELIAKSLHLAGPRAQGPFIALNCAAIPETLLESELFGYERGAFTGAHRNKKGLLSRADQGSFFLDEISEMPYAMQAKLLRVLDEKVFSPLGAEKSVSVDTRIIAASNRNLEEEVSRGRFREDLFYRIHVIVIHLPPLRDRREDIPLLAQFFLDKVARKTGREMRGFTPEALQKMMAHPWPGNVRELENTVEAAVVMSEEEVISGDVILKDMPRTEGGLKPLKTAKDRFERDYLVQLIEMTQGNVSQAAKLAGKYRADFYELLRKHGLDPEAFRKK